MKEVTDPRQLLVVVAETLDRLKIAYFITGGMAVVVWGRPRFTADIDAVVELKAEDIDSLAEELLKIGEASYISTEAMEDALKEKGEFNFIDGNTGMKVDFWVSEGNEFDESRMQRKIAKDILGYKIYFSSPEDLILIKLLWYKKSGSTRHVEDIESVFAISDDLLDKTYLSKWVEKFGVQDIYSRVEK